MILVAVDPGLSGALALYDTEIRDLKLRDMPTYERKVSGAKAARRFLDEAEVLSILQWGTVMGAEMLVIEEVGGLPGQSGSAAFTFGYGVAVVVTTARLLGMRIERVRPAKWKQEMNCPADKRAARARASELLPAYADQWKLAKHDGRAEAALLALYAERRRL